MRIGSAKFPIAPSSRLPLHALAALFARAILLRRYADTLRASARRLGLADALCRHRNRGALERLLGAHHSLTRTGPYDVLRHEVCGRRSASGARLEFLPPLLRLLRRFRRCLLSTFSHCCPPSHVTWRVSHQRAPRIDAHCISFTTAQRKKQCPA